VRLAFASPLPPAPTGIADYAADVLRALAADHEIDVFHEQQEVDAGRLPPSCAIHAATQLLPRHGRDPYDVVVYQMGNGLHHAFLYPLLPRAPGLLVLHDLVLHHSRARMLLDTPAARAYAREPWSAARRTAAAADLEAYTAEVAHSYPDQAARLVPAHLGTVGELLPYAYPLFRLPVEAARVVAVHNGFMAEAVKADVPSAEVVRVAMPVETLSVAPGGAAAVRARHRVGAGDFVVGCFGLLTREKQLDVVARAVARAAVHLPGLRLLLVGAAPDRDALDRLLERTGIRARARVTGHVPFAELGAYLEAVDLVAHLRYPTARETSAALLRALAQGRPAVVSDLENLAEVPEGAAVRVEATDEEGGLLRAVLHLAGRPAARAALGARARAFAAAEHSRERCRATYAAALVRTAARSDPERAAWPRHWRGAGQPA
jgi:glycosyltransferase involved in cell wall biosynthesis